MDWVGLSNTSLTGDLYVTQLNDYLYLFMDSMYTNNDGSSQKNNILWHQAYVKFCDEENNFLKKIVYQITLKYKI